MNFVELYRAEEEKKKTSEKKKSEETMKTILSSETMDIPEGVSTKLIKEAETGKRKLKIDSWFGSRKSSASIRTALSHVDNLITGVTRGFRYKMRFVYAHFPINASIGGDSKSIEIRNFLWREEGSCDNTELWNTTGDPLILDYICVKKKDMRKFLDVSEKSKIVEEE
ncbi:hypothetical protein N665_0073s0009 [Sinapis alba]|nr:hypothetical protein N665_0073s0009 [Sinapis alba]